MSDDGITRREFVQGTAAAAGAAAVGLGAAGQAAAAKAEKPHADKTKTRSYNADMEYRRLGRTGLWLSAISIGGHWKKIPYRYRSKEFKKNRAEVLGACMEHGINYIDACTGQEVLAYSEALGKRRQEMFFGYSWYQHESRFKGWQDSVEKMKQGFVDGLKQCKLKHADLWRITMHEQTSRRNTQKHVDVAIAALDWAKKEGLARFTGVSTHDRKWAADAVAKYPQLEVIVTPYTAASKAKPKGSVFEALQKQDVGMIGIKPFASGSVFRSRGRPDSSTKDEDDKRARMVLRYVLCCDTLTAAIPGLITIDQVKNAAAAVKERREFDLKEAAEYRRITEEMWANLPEGYEWLRDWEWV